MRASSIYGLIEGSPQFWSRVGVYVADGKRFWEYFAKPGVKYLVSGCDARMQRTMYEDALAEAGVDFDQQVTALDLRNMKTNVAINKVQESLTGMNS